MHYIKGRNRIDTYIFILDRLHKEIIRHFKDKSHRLIKKANLKKNTGVKKILK